MASVATSNAKRGLRGGGITVIAQLSKTLLQLVSLVVLSRLLDPDDFGLVAMVTVALALGDLLRDFGMPTAALQARELSHQQASNMFWVNALLGSAAAVLVIASTPLLAALYDEPRLTPLVPALALTLVLNGLQVQLQVQLARAGRFLALNLTDLLAQVVALVAAIGIAVAGGGYWALVAQAVMASIALLLLRTSVARWLPARPARGAGTLETVRAGAHIGASQVLTFASANVDTIVIGAALGPAEVGYYNRAFQLLTAPISRLLGPLTQVALPTFNARERGPRERNEILLKLQFLLGAPGVVVFAATAAVASPLVDLLLGPGWERTAPIFAILAVGGCFNVLSYVSYWAFLVHAKPRELLRYNLVSKPMVIALVCVGSLYGLHGVATGYSAGLAFSWLLNLFWLGRTVELPAVRFLLNGGKLLVSGGLGFIAGSLCERLVGEWAGTAGGLAAGLAAAITVTSASILVFPSSRGAAADLKRLVRS
ncbi:oligosaccharide flippase family protein [Aeromicrobium sp. 636]|uniref:Lipopolysaccharide biosynthesis protein n=1 Tax=Aeromicrobium senzhongii TaxID=2663859 RepID=A0A8I0EWY1_9ACTN|nr:MULTISPECIES: lipopolysaccharide biosynthesis protein [Aeromicrobium]MBC9226842.1 lipopolysaccharide biosynthesis protein [Aeromicrobium senzhongii]MCQ3998942.1 oligosaccharide flippase family protein [Aeromicrobium sp. 636]